MQYTDPGHIGAPDPSSPSALPEACPDKNRSPPPTDAVQSACGFSSAATGPFYCPSDQKLYLDTSFFDELSRMGGPGDFAQAYVIAYGRKENPTRRAWTQSIRTE